MSYFKFTDIIKCLAGEVVREIIGSSLYHLKIGKIKSILGEKVGSKRFLGLEKCLTSTSRQGSDANDAWSNFVKHLEDVKWEGTGTKIKFKITADREKLVQNSTKTYIMEGLTLTEYRMAILIEALKTALDSDDVNHQGLKGNTVLHFLSALPSEAKVRQAFLIKLIELLVENNPDYSIKNDQGLTALHIIVGNYVLDPNKGFDPADKRGLECKTNIIGRYKMLLCFKIEKPFDVRGPSGNSILHEWIIQRACCSREFQENDNEDRIGQWIITNAGVPPTKTNDFGCTSLHYAFTDRLVKFLCENNAEKERRSDSGETPLMYILKHSFFRVLVSKVLPTGWDLEITLSSLLGIKRGLDINLEKINVSDPISLEVLEKLNFNLKEKDHLNEDRDCLDYLICILRECASEGCTQENRLDFERLLILITKIIEKGATLNEGKVGHKSRLYQMLRLFFEAFKEPSEAHKVIKNKIFECVKTMLEANADPNPKGSDESTALHFCCHKVDPRDKQQKRLVELLCEYGADPEVKNKDGVTPIQILKELRKNERCASLGQKLKSLKPCLRVQVDIKSKRYGNGLDSLCRKKIPEKVGSLRYDPQFIGKGAMSSIYLAIDEKSKREVALKRILKDSFEKGLQSEIKFLVELEQNPNVVKYYFLEEDANFHFIAIELMEGDLSHMVQEYSSLRLNEEMTVKLANNVVEGLKFLHSKDILHRDLKPGNILYRRDPELCLKIADFGLAKHLVTPSVNQSTVLGSTSSSLTGTRGWMAPELVKREVKEHSKESDMFALGLVLHFLISKGFHPFDQSGSPLNTAITNGTLKPHELETNICAGNLQYLWKDLTPEGKQLMELLLSKNPFHRQSAKDLLRYNCYFWSNLKKIEFMKTIGDQEEIAKPAIIYISVWKLESSVFGDFIKSNNWNIELSHLFNELCPRRWYDTTSVVDLIRFFRNAYAHFEERSTTCKNQLLSEVFSTKFPDFFLTVWKVVYELGWMKENSGRDWILRILNEMK